MSDKKLFRRQDVIPVAKELCDLLTPVTDRLSVCGSLRRRKQMVSDIELLFIPKYEDEREGLFDTKEVDLADRLIETWHAAGFIEKRPSKIGVYTWGMQNKLAIHTRTRIPIDFFATDEARWWMAKVIRTGGKQTNLDLTTGAQALGRKLHAYGRGFTDSDGSELVCASEEDVFKYAGVPYREPHMRH